MYKNILILAVASFIINGCASAPKIKMDEQKNLIAQDRLKFNDNTLKSQVLQPAMITPIEIKRTGKEISFSAEKVNLRQALFAISKSANLGIVIDNDVDTTTIVTLSLDKSPIETVLNNVARLGNCSYEIKENTIYVNKYEQQVFSVPYTQSNTIFDSELGGDVLGSNKTEGSAEGGLKGSFKVGYKSPLLSTDYYAQLEKNVKDMLSANGRYTLNRFTGTLIVNDTRKNLAAIEGFIKKVKKSASRQVFIDAKILEVVLNNSHQLGVDWSTLPGALGDFTLKQTLGLSGAVAGSLAYKDKHIDAVMSALDTAGDIDALSNPKIKVSSGQSAIISSGKIVPFWEKEVTFTNSTAVGSVSTPVVTYKRRDILDGLSLGVTPTITEDGRIILNVVPITSNIEETVNLTDISVSGTSSVIASAPILSVKEAGTVVYAKDNEVVVIGGLISNVKKTVKKSVPILGDIPGIGKLFTQEDNKEEKRELVILLKLNIIDEQ